MRKSFAVGFLAISLSLWTSSARADYLPGLTNLNFTTFTGSSPKDTFVNVDPTGWTGGSGLIFIDSPVPGHDAMSGAPVMVPTYFDPSPNLVGNYVEADGNPTFESGFNTMVTGLTPGTTYTLSFFQAASQQVGFTGATTEQWIVSLGTAGLATNPPCTLSQTSCTYSNADPTASIAISQLMNTPSQGVTNWQPVTLSLTADATTDLLSFLAWGDGGNTTNLPPIVFLSGVDSPNLLTPEPGSLLLLATIVAGLGFAAVRRRRTAKVV